MKTITSKTAINGAKLWYVDGKRTSRDKAVETSIANGRENLSNLMTGLTSDDNQNFGIVADMKSEFGDRYVERFYFATAEDAVTAAKKIVVLGELYRLTTDNGRPYPSNIRYADSIRGSEDLLFFNGFKGFGEVNDSDGHIDGFDESAFDLLPTVDELNDCRSDIEKEFDEFAAEDTDRDARFNHGERHAAKLEKQLRDLAPTVEVTYDIDTDGEDVFYLRFGEYVNRAPFATLDAVEETFHLWREDDEPTETKRTDDKRIWHIGRDSRGEAYPYRVGEGGEEVVADNCDDDECREVEEQLGMIYVLKEDYPGLLVSGWYDEDDPRLKGGCNESYSWREVESGYYRDVL